MKNVVQQLFSRRLKSLREKQEVTMVELAETIGMSQATISEWEKGNKFPRAGALQQLANYFDVPMEYFFKENIYLNVNTISMPFYSSVKPLDWPPFEALDKEDIEYVKMPASFLGKYALDDRLFAFTITVKSMNALIPENAPVIAQKIEVTDMKNGDIIVYYFNGEYAVRRFRKDESQEVIVLSAESTNQNYYDQVIPIQSIDEVKVLAKIIWYGVTL